MRNWFKKARLGVDVSPSEPEEVMYSAVIPIDIRITSTGNSEVDQEKAYNMIKEILENGSGPTAHEGFRENLQLSAVQRSSQ